MKYPFLLAIVFAFACKKNDGGGSAPTPTPDYTPVPVTTPVNTAVKVYVPGNSQANKPYTLQYSNLAVFTYDNTFNYFATPGTLTGDKYLSRLMFRPSFTVDYPGYQPWKTYTALDAAKTYVNVKLLPTSTSGQIQYDYGSGIMNLPAGGQLVLPSYSFGVYGTAATYYTYAGYTNPYIKDYAVHMPCYAMADLDGSRWYLRSYGMYLLCHRAMDNTSWNIDYSSNANVKLRMPIPANLQSSAPDSIGAFTLNTENVWVRSGFATRNGSFYEKRVTKKGFWNFAVPVKGVYVTMKLITAANITLPNIHYVVKSDGAEIADGKTDANGNALLFVPSNTSLTIDYYNEHTYGNSTSFLNQPLGSFSQASNISVQFPATPQVLSITGDVLDCNGNAIAAGSASMLLSPQTNDEYQVPIKDGKFSMANWIRETPYFPTTIKIYDANGGLLRTQVIQTGSPNGNGSNIHTKFYTCVNAAKLFSIYNKDGIEYQVDANTNSATPILTSTLTDVIFHKITIDNNGKGISFHIWFDSGGAAYYRAANVAADGVAVTYDYTNYNPEIYVTRNDNVSGGFREGWFGFEYLDAANQRHKISGNFRVKIN